MGKNGQGKTILVVDDEPYIQDSLRLFLELEGFEVITASNGEEALKRLSEGVPDLIILDMMMPEMDGYEFAKRLRGNEAWRNIYVMALTALSQNRDRTRSTEVGINEHITKPYRPEILIERIKSVLPSPAT